MNSSQIIRAARRELATRYAVRGTTDQLRVAVDVLEDTGAVDSRPRRCRHSITTVDEDTTRALVVRCLACGAVL